MKKRIAGILLAAAMIVGMIPLSAVTAFAEHAHTFAQKWTYDNTGHWHACTEANCDIEDYAACGLAGADYGEHDYIGSKCAVCGKYAPRTSHTYTDENGETQTSTKCYDLARNEAVDDLTFNDGEWYFVQGTFTVNNRIENNAPEENPAHIILGSYAVLNASMGIHNPAGKGLVIYTYSTEREGMLTAKATGASNANAGIGGNNGESGGSLTVCGGTVVADGGNMGGAGIGGGYEGDGGSITIAGGTVTATGGFDNGGAGIGGGYTGNGGKITITGGTVTATGLFASAGIGGGIDGNGGNIKVTGGKVIAKGDYTAGIGGGLSCTDHGKFTLGEGLDLFAGTSAEKCSYLIPQLYAYTRDPYTEIIVSPTYAVRHLKQNEAKTGYDLAETETFSAHTGEKTAASFKNYDGFTPQVYDQQTVKKDGSTVVEIYYDRISSAHMHTFESEYSSDETHHWYACTCGHAVAEGFGEHAFGEGVIDGNKTTLTCSACGYTKTVYEGGSTEGEPIAGAVKCDGISLSLESDIYINFYMRLNDAALATGKMSFAIGDRRIENAPVKVNGDNGRYYFACPLNALEMAETVTATFTYGNATYVQTHSVEQYVREILGGDYAEDAQELARKIANYGYYAQLYLESIHSNVKIGGDGYAPMLSVFKDDLTVSDALALKDGFTATKDTESFTFDGRTVYFDSATALNYYIVTKDGAAPKAACPDGKTVEVKLYKDKTYIVSVRDISATELGDTFTVTVGEGTDSMTLKGSVLDYCAAVIDAHNVDDPAEKDTRAVNAMAAFHEYYKAAMEYISFELHFDMPGHYKVFTADGDELKGETTVKCYRSFSFRLVPDDNYKIDEVISEGYIEPDENKLYTVSFIGGKHDVVILTGLETVLLTVTVEGEEGPKVPDTRISFIYDSHEIVHAWSSNPGVYEMDVPKGKSGTIVVEKSGYREYRQEFTVDGSIDEINIALVPSGSYIVTFDMMGHGEQISRQTVKNGEKVQKPLDPTAEGCIFGGWYKDQSLDRKWNFSIDTVTADTTLYAKWTENKPTLENGYYLVGTLDGKSYEDVSSLNAGMMLEANAAEPGEYTIDWTFCEDDKVKIAKVENHVITTWYKSGVKNYYTVGADEAGEGTLHFRSEGSPAWTYTYFTVIPKKAPEYTVSFSMNEHGTAPDSRTVEKGGKVTKPADPTADGYRFDGWYKEAGCVNAWDFDNDTVTADTTLYAKWTAYNATYVVSLWDVTADGAVFGPATGADSSCLNHAHKDSSGCIHNDSWETIKANLQSDPAYYNDCIEEGCTKDIPLVLNDTLFSGTAASNPSSVLYSSINSDYRKYNNSDSASFCESANWATSRLRATLNGCANGTTEIFCPSTYAGNNCLTVENCLLSCFPKELQNIIVARTYTVATQWRATGSYEIELNETVCDKLWLPTANEIYASGLSTQYSDYGMVYQAKVNNTTGAYSKNKAFDETGTDRARLLRSPRRDMRNYVAVAYSNGALSSVLASAASAGIAPCFCIG